MSTRATVALTRTCSNRCMFCAAPEGDDDLDWESALRTARDESSEVTFVGGEPTVSPDLEAAVAAAGGLGFKRIGIQTNGSGLDAARLAELHRVGLTDVHVSVHAATATAHDYHVGQAGRFDQCANVLQWAATLGLTAVVLTVVTRSNFRVLGELPPWLRAHSVAAWVCQWPHVAGRAGHNFDRVVPRLGLAVPYALHALERARRVGLPAAIAGTPVCALGPYAQHRLSSPVRSHPGPCGECDARTDCPGVDASYVARFTDDELHPRPTVPNASSLRPAEQRMFVGVGRMADPSVAVQVPPAAARRRLPVLGRPAPATAETKRKSELRPDHEAQALFPGLFEGDDATADDEP